MVLVTDSGYWNVLILVEWNFLIAAEEPFGPSSLWEGSWQPVCNSLSLNEYLFHVSLVLQILSQVYNTPLISNIPVKFLSFTSMWWYYCVSANLTSSNRSSSVRTSYSWWKVSPHWCNCLHTIPTVTRLLYESVFSEPLLQTCSTILYMINDAAKLTVTEYSSCKRMESHLTSSAQNLKIVV